MARPSAIWSAASTMKWMWLPWMEKWMSRTPNRLQPFCRAWRRAVKQRCERRFQTSSQTRVETCTAPLRNFTRTRCFTLGRGDLRLRPAPFLFPPHCRNGSSC